MMDQSEEMPHGTPQRTPSPTAAKIRLLYRCTGEWALLPSIKKIDGRPDDGLGDELPPILHRKGKHQRQGG
jgi:hypothetical protein